MFLTFQRETGTLILSISIRKEANMKFADLHCDTLLSVLTQNGVSPETLWHNGGHLDLSRLLRADAAIEFFAIFLPPRERLAAAGYSDEFTCVQDACQLLDQASALEPNRIGLALTSEDVRRNLHSGCASAIRTVEDGRLVDGSFRNLDRLFAMGIRLITLTWNYANCFGYPNSTSPAEMSRGLTDFGKEAVLRMNELGILVDVSHLSDGGFWDVQKIAKKPFVASHSNARALCPHPRNLTDDMIRARGNAGGVIGLNFCPSFLETAPDGKSPRSTAAALLRHARHLANVGGIDCVAIGSDFDGIEETPEEIPSCLAMPRLAEAMEQNGFTHTEVEKVFSENVRRFLKENL